MAQKRAIVLDTETTGLKPREGHRIVEVAFLEMLDGKPTGEKFHSLINPGRSIPQEVVNIHGIDNEKVKDAPKFEDVVESIYQFVIGDGEPTELVAHNLQFDMEFLNHECHYACRKPVMLLTDIPNVVAQTCTRDISRYMWPRAARHRLDDVLDRLGIDRSSRTLHGALLDAELCMEALMGMRSRP